MSFSDTLTRNLYHMIWFHLFHIQYSTFEIYVIRSYYLRIPESLPNAWFWSNWKQYVHIYYSTKKRNSEVNCIRGLLVDITLIHSGQLDMCPWGIFDDYIVVWASDAQSIVKFLFAICDELVHGLCVLQCFEVHSYKTS